jgi:TP901-1 family phage major tail protein
MELVGKNYLLKLASVPAIKSKLQYGDLIYEAKTAGVAGNSTTIEYVDSAAGGLAITVASSDIEVDFGGDTVTAADIKAAIEADSSANALVAVREFGEKLTETQAVTAQASLEDGFDAVTTSVTVGGLRSKTMTINNEAIDVTNHLSEEFKKLADQAGIRSHTISGSGVFTNDANLNHIRRLSYDGVLARFDIIDVTASKKFVGYYKIVSMERAGDYNNEQTYSLSLESSGETTYQTA